MYCWATEKFLGLEMWKPLFITTWFFSTKPPFSYLRNMNGIICISEEQLLWVIITALGLCFSKESWARSIFQQPRNFSIFCRSDPTVKCQKWPVNWLLRSDPRRVFGETPLTPYRAIAHLGSPAGGEEEGIKSCPAQVWVTSHWIPGHRAYGDNLDMRNLTPTEIIWSWIST